MIVPFRSALALDLSQAQVVVPTTLSARERKAVTMLIEEVEKRTQIRWAESNKLPASAKVAIAVGPVAALREFGGEFASELTNEQPASAAEGFRIRIKKQKSAVTVFVIGNDSRGVLFGVGRLLRELRMQPGRVSLADNFSVTTAPKYLLRGHQLGYRPKTNSYDAWDLDRWEQYFRDLAVFGCNAIELIPPRSDDDADSPHFPRPPMEMMTGMSRLADDYGLDVWIWYPAMDKDYSDARTVEYALNEWSEVFKKLPRIDVVFVPGGDPGHTQPKVLMALLEKQTGNLHRFHPRAQMWVSPQSFNQEWFDEFIGILRNDQPAWLSGVVFGPQVRGSLAQLRALVPSRYPIRHYPDITHSRQCQYPVPDWDTAFAITEGRECINPRPLGEAAIFRATQPGTVGFLTYSEGCNDDVNKFIWSGLGWDPDQSPANILCEYSRYFIGDKFAERFAQGLLALEQDWRGPLLANRDVLRTLALFQSLEKAAAPDELKNWRFQQALLRAYYDAYTRIRLAHEKRVEARALEKLRTVSKRGSESAMREAEVILDRGAEEMVAVNLRRRIFELAEELYQSIRMQLSVEKYKAIAVDRGAMLDTVDYPLNNRRWLKERFAALRRLDSEAARLKGIAEIVNWTNPGLGGFYDDLGNVAYQPHLVRGSGYDRDPAFLESSRVDFEEWDVVDKGDEKPAGAVRYSWLDHAESLFDAPLRMHYANLDSTAQYRLRVVYGGDSPRKKICLIANDKVEIHPFIQKPFPFQPLEFDVPREATRRGELDLSWFGEPGQGGNGRSCQVSEVWLLKP
ncbi:MAG: hypothetical protein HY043_00500 [Verrucomicrobia bacterium]|nr:hypothetical protein [Verrucomicrobiota bacterium]